MPERIRDRLDAALARVVAGEPTPEVRRVHVMDLVVRDQDRNPDELAACIRADPMPDGDLIAVMEIADGRFWAFADGYTVKVWQVMRPNVQVRVAIIPLGDGPRENERVTP